MTINDYEKDGGFKKELLLLKEIGERINQLNELVPVRPHRQPEIDALKTLSGSLTVLRSEIGQTRNC